MHEKPEKWCPLSLKSILKCIINYKYRKLFQNAKGFWYQELNTWPMKKGDGDMMVRALVYSLFSHSSVNKNPYLWVPILSKNKNKYVFFFFFFLTWIIKNIRRKLYILCCLFKNAMLYTNKQFIQLNSNNIFMMIYKLLPKNLKIYNNIILVLEHY